ncbi:hypothetical protein Hanom_Chr12g01174021 [Helianthus anomalus]
MIVLNTLHLQEFIITDTEHESDPTETILLHFPRVLLMVQTLDCLFREQMSKWFRHLLLNG